MNGNIDDNELMQNHDKVNNSNEPAQSSEIGGAAALSAIKNAISGSNGGSGGQSASGGGDMQSKIIGMAMSHASALWSSKNAAGAANGSQQDAVNSAGEKAMQLMMKYKVDNMIGGGSSSGLSSLLGSVM